MLGVEIVALALEGWDGFVDLKRWEFRFVSDSGSGLTELLRGDVSAAWARAIRNAGALRAQVGGWPASIGFTAAATIAVVSLMRRGQTRRAWPLSLFVAAATLLLWWVGMSPSARLRHAVPGLVLLSAGLALSIAGASRRWALAIGIATAIGVAPSFPTLWRMVPREWPGASRRVVAMRTTAAWLERRERDVPVLAGWWASVVDLEYLLSTPDNFSPVRGVAPGDVPRALVVMNERWMMAREDHRRQPLEELIQFCDAQLVLDAAPYFVYRCSSRGLEAGGEGQRCFDADWYRRAYPKATGKPIGGAADPWRHWVEIGRHDSRITAWDPDAPPLGCDVLPHDRPACFDEAWYLRAYPDVAAAVASGRIRSGYQHWMLQGREVESRRPFDPAHPPAGCE